MYIRLSLTPSFLLFSIFEGMEVRGSVLAGIQWYQFFSFLGFFHIPFLLRMITSAVSRPAEERFMDDDALGMYPNVVSKAHSLYLLEG